MSGMSGYFLLDSDKVSESQLWSMAQAVERRGSDYQNVLAQGVAGMAFAGLNTTPQSLLERQPINIGNLSVVADVRLDNRDELYHQFELAGLQLDRSAGDAEYILHAYRLWHVDCPKHLMGAFAFAIWDYDEQQVFGARDHLGVKPFVYHHRQGKVFAWASDILSLLALDYIPKQLNEARIADYIVHQLEGRNHEITLFEDIYRLPAGHRIRVRADQFHIDQYWQLEAQPELMLASDEAYVEAFLEIFEKAVHRRLCSVSPDQVGVTVSGGIDSSSVAGIARDYYLKTFDQPLKTFSATSVSGKDDDETAHIMAVIEQDGFDGTTIRSDELSDYLPELRYIINNHTNLNANIMEIPHLTHIAAKRQGIRIMLDGMGGDEVIAYNQWYIAILLRQGQFREAIHEAKCYGQFYGGNYYPFRQVMRSELIRAFVPQFIRRARQKLRRSDPLSQEIQASFIHPQFAEQQKIRHHLQQLRKTLDNSDTWNPSEKWARWLRHPYMPVALERYDDVASIHGIESRHPFFDRELLEFCLSLPINQHIRHGWTKYILRCALGGTLPDHVCWRRGKASLSSEFTTARYRLEKLWIKQQINNHWNLVEHYFDTNPFNEKIIRPFFDHDIIDYGELWTVTTLISYIVKL